MNWVIDTCVVIDVLEDDPKFGARSANLLEEKKSEGLEISPITHVELAPAFLGNLVEQRRFLDLAGIVYGQTWTTSDTETAHHYWHLHVKRRRDGSIPKRPIADILIGAYASRRRGLITRNAGDFRKNFPKLIIIEP